jgi:hypothetical protein
MEGPKEIKRIAWSTVKARIEFLLAVICKSYLIVIAAKPE